MYREQLDWSKEPFPFDTLYPYILKKVQKRKNSSPSSPSGSGGQPRLGSSPRSSTPSSFPGLPRGSSIGVRQIKN